MRRVLFVDDEQHVLDGLENVLRRQREHWEMVFALGGQAALAELRKAPFDVVVCDMRMPGIDGATLLARVRDEHPSTTRIVLSGHADREAVVRVVPVAHQFLSKPCDAEALRVVIERTSDLNALLKDDAIRGVAGKLDKLPSVPRTYWELIRAVAEPEVSIADIAKIVLKDPAMSAKVLQLVNSAYFGLAQRMTSVHQAVMYLGIDLLKGLALTAHIFATMEAARVEGFARGRLQQYALLTAKLSLMFSNDAKQGEDAFTAALVHDIGKIIVALGLPQCFEEVVRAARETGRAFHVIEKERIGVTHAEIGAYLLGVWGLPFPIVEAVAFHHSPSLVTQGPCEVLAAVHVADALVDTACTGESEPPLESKLDMAFLERTGLAAQLPKWRAIAERETRVLRNGTYE